jgi:hypothetical protein
MTGKAGLRTAWPRSATQSGGPLPTRGAGPAVVAAVAAERANHVGSALLQTFSNRALPFHRVPVTPPIDEIVARLNQIQPTSLAGYPSMLHVLAEHARAGELRVDLATGAETVWFYRAGTYPALIGLDSLGRPVVRASGNGLNDVLLLDHPGSPGQLVTSSKPWLQYLQGDGDRLWFGGPYGIYLYRPNGGFQKVFAYNGGNYAYPAGFCR